MPTTDGELSVLLSRLPMKQSFEPQTNHFEHILRVHQNDFEVIEEIIECLINHPEFSFVGSLFFDTAQLYANPHSSAPMLAAYAINHGTKKAIDWYRYILNLEKTKVRHASLVSGLNTKTLIEFSNGVSFLPLNQAGESPQVTGFQSLSMPNPLHSILGTHYNVVAFKDAEHDRSERIPIPTFDRGVVEGIEEVLVGCILNEGLAPALIVNWDEFLDPKLKEATNSWGTSGSPQDAPVNSGRLLKEADIPNIELFLKMQGKFKKKLRIALSRVGLARRKHVSANRAIEYSIALEALLCDDKSEMTHKISTRAAIILSNNYEERVRFKRLFSKLYNLRSMAVHGGDVSEGNWYEVVKESEKAISKLLLIAAKRGKSFDFEKLDLQGEI